MSGAKAHFAESIPYGMEIAKTRGVESTADDLIRLTNSAQHTIALTAMYWALNPNPDSPDENGWSETMLVKHYGADRGIELYRALGNAANRGVRIRILTSPSFNPKNDELAKLKKAHPKQIDVHIIDMPSWYGEGFMHQKLWVFDDESVYIGSANMDWKSFTQVKELGIVLENAAEVANEVLKFLEPWWKFSRMNPALNTATVFDPSFQIERKVPTWSKLVSSSEKIRNPFGSKKFRTNFNWSSPLELEINGEYGQLALSGAPVEVCAPSRTFDQDMLVNTILGAKKRVSVCVMDFAPVSLYRGTWSDKKGKFMIGRKVASPVWWPALIDALLHVISTKQVHGRLLISEWAHTSVYIGSYLDALSTTANSALVNSAMAAGKLEIRRFRVPGWQSTGPVTDRCHPNYPGHTRVGHAKYIVTDNRINVGTSNMAWDYFSTTAGASFNANHPELVRKLQKIFERDWRSKYASAEQHN